MQFDYDALNALAAVVREGRFESAAKSLEISQSAVSQRIKHLEEKVGCVLIIRGRPCVPTDAGLQLCRHVEQVNLLQHELGERMSSIVGGSLSTAASVRISVNNDSLATWFPEVIRRAADELGIRFDILPDDQEHTEHSLKSGDALAVVTAIEKPVQGCRRYSLGAMDYHAVASREFYDRHFGDGVDLDALQKATCLSFDRKDTIQDQWMNIAFGETVPLSLHYVPSYEGYFQCCMNGTAWGLVPGSAAHADIEAGRLFELVPETAVRVSLHWQVSTHSSESLSRLSEIVIEEAGKNLLPDDFRQQ